MPGLGWKSSLQRPARGGRSNPQLRRAVARYLSPVPGKSILTPVDARSGRDVSNPPGRNRPSGGRPPPPPRGDFEDRRTHDRDRTPADRFSGARRCRHVAECAAPACAGPARYPQLRRAAAKYLSPGPPKSPRSVPHGFWPRAWFPHGRSVRPAIAQTRRHRYLHSCVEPSLWLRRRFHKLRPGFETH
jgi:hypothetical protein